MESLSDKLKSLGFRPASQVEAPKPSLHESEFSRLIPGSIVSNSLGEFYLARTEFPLGYQHGRVQFDHLLETKRISSITINSVNQDIGAGQGIVFLDTETTGLSGGTGTFAFLIGIGYSTGSGFTVDQYLIREPSEEPAMLLAVANFIGSKTCITTFNGKAFDLPLMNSRYILNRLEKPFENLYHLDMLHISRKIWKNRLPSRALQDLEREILAIPRDENEVPGWMIPEIYFEYLKNHDPRRLSGVMYHNRMDILSLAAITYYVSDALKNLENRVYEMDPLDLFSIAKIYDNAGLLKEAEEIYQVCLADDHLGDSVKRDIFSRTGYLNKKKEEWQQAINMFTLAASLGDYNACIELSKVYEHHFRDEKVSLEWCVKANNLVSSSLIPRYKKNQILRDLEVRTQRLLKKMLIERSTNE